jgi:hypothetical protein
MIGAVGVATLRYVRDPRTLLFASLPILFAAHQFTEGWVWLGLEGRFDKLAFDHFTFLFMLYAYCILPLLMPTAVALMEPPGWRRRAIVGLVGVGALAFVWNASGIIFFPTRCVIVQNSVAYHNTMTGNIWSSCLYVLAACGAVLLSSHRAVRWYGVLNALALAITEVVRQHAFASVWCFYAAIMSVVIYWQFRHLKIEIGPLNGSSPIVRRFLLSWLRMTRVSGSKAA